MAGKVTCSCGKQYTWKPDLAGKRAKCKCGAVVSFPATDPAADEVPEGFDDSGLAGDDAPPPPPPPPVGANVPPPPPAAAYGNMPRGKIGKGATTGAGGFSGKVLWNGLIGVGVIAFGIYIYLDIRAKEAAGEAVRIGRSRRGWIIRWLYDTLGPWGVLGLFVVAGLAFIGTAVFMYLGKTSTESDNE